jgi:predicted metal-binding membrane protein
MPAAIAEAVFRRDRTIVSAGLGGVILLAWAYMFHMAQDMTGAMDAQTGMMGMAMSMPDPRPWGAVDLGFIFLMWVVMQIAMMIPSASPMILVFAKLNRQRLGERSSLFSTALFFLGYVLMWTAFSVAATLAQWGLHSAALISPMMVSTSSVLGGLILIGAGIFQFTPLKEACLRRCRSPLGYFLTEWREGPRGALIMGLRHGGFCVVCCWLLMALLFVAGVMNLLWIAAIAVYILIEKVVPRGRLVSRAIGVLVIVWGVWLLAGGPQIPGA